MGFIGDTVSGLLGGGKKGINFDAKQANLIQPATLDQANQGYGQAQSGLGQQQNFVNALMGANALGGQNSLAQQLQGVANGTGPNPALQQLQNTTGQNMANQAALMAGQRGSAANAGLIARQIGQQGAQIQQQAAGQGAALQAQQQLNAMNALQNLYGQQVSQQQGGLNAYNQLAQNQYSQLLGALGNYNQAQVGNASQANSSNAAVAQKTAGAQAGLFGGLGNALGAGSKFLGDSFLGPVAEAATPFADTDFSAAAIAPDIAMALLNKGGQVGPKSFYGQAIHKSKGGKIAGKVPGKADVSGDSLKNDKVPAMLSPGEIVIPRSVVQSDDPVHKSAKFVEAIVRRGKK